MCLLGVKVKKQLLEKSEPDMVKKLTKNTDIYLCLHGDSQTLKHYNLSTIAAHHA